MRNHVRFGSDLFTPTRPEDEQVNPGRYGEELANWLIDRLTRAGLGSSGPYTEDWGWLLEATREARRFVISCGNMPHSKTSWEVWVEPAPGLLQKRLRRQEVGGVLGVCHMLHEALSAEEGVRDIDWFQVDRRGRDWDHSPRPS